MKRWVDWIYEIRTVDNSVECKFRCIGDDRCDIYSENNDQCYLGSFSDPPDTSLVDTTLSLYVYFKNGSIDDDHVLSYFYKKVANDPNIPYGMLADYIWTTMIKQVAFPNKLMTDIDCARFCFIEQPIDCTFFAYADGYCNYGNFNHQGDISGGQLGNDTTIFLRKNG